MAIVPVSLATICFIIVRSWKNICEVYDKFGQCKLLDNSLKLSI